MRFLFNGPRPRAAQPELMARHDRGRRPPSSLRHPARRGRAAIVARVVGLVLLASPSVLRAQFSPGPNPISGTVAAPQALSGGTGTIEAGGKISIASGSAVPLQMTGTSTLINNGTIETLGSGRAIDSNSGSAILNVTNAGLISSVQADAFRVNTNSAVALTNSGTIRVTNGGQAIDWAAITSMSNVLRNLATGVITAVGEDAVRPGTNGVIENAGTIAATPTGGAAPSGSDGVDVRTFSGIRVTNSGSISGRHGIATDGSNAGPSTITVNNEAGGTIAGLNGSGLNIDGVSAGVTATVTNQAGATIKGGVLAEVTDGDGDGIDVDGVLTLDNRGDVLGLGAKGLNEGQPNGAQAVSIGGGTIRNFATGRIIGSTLASDAPGGDPTRPGEGILADNSSGGPAVAATSVINDGLIQGKTGAAIRIVGTFADSVTNNQGGIIRGGGTGAAIQAGDGANTVVNRGSIVGDNGKAIDLQGGDDTLTIGGGAASILGDVTGGAGTNTLRLALSSGESFAYAGSISDFATVEVLGGHTTLSGASTYAGTTRVTGGVLTLVGANRLAGTSALDLNGGILEIAGGSGANGQTFASLLLGDTSTIDLGGSSLTFAALGPIVAGKTLAILGYDPATSPQYAFRFAGDYSRDPAFLALVGRTTISGLGARYHFDGAFTNVASVPEPASLVLVGLGVLGLVPNARRRLARS